MGLHGGHSPAFSWFVAGAALLFTGAVVGSPTAYSYGSFPVYNASLLPLGNTTSAAGDYYTRNFRNNNDSRSSLEDLFRCANGVFIYKKWLCDGDIDCKDGSDERNCAQDTTAASTCPNGMFTCTYHQNPYCINNSFLCDGLADCPDGEDEGVAQCACAPNMIRCPDGKCIPLSWVCDGQNDCSDQDSFDEINCTTPYRTSPQPVYNATVPSLDTIVIKPNETKQDPAKKEENSEKLTVETSGSSSAQETHFALSLVPLLRAQPPAARLDAETAMLGYFKRHGRRLDNL